MKRITVLRIVLAVLLLLTACAGDPHDQTQLAQTPIAESSTLTESEIVQTLEEPWEASSESQAAQISPEQEVDGALILDYEEPLEYAAEFTLTHYQGGYKGFTVAALPNKTYLVIPEGKSVPEDLPKNTVILQQPIKKICMCTTGMVSLADAIGGLDYIATVGTDVNGWYLDNVIDRMNAGTIVYSGKYREPDFELLLKEGIQLEIDTTMINDYPDILAKYDELGIPYLIDSSSQEANPLGRIEWVKLFGAIVGLNEQAHDFYEAQSARIKTISSAEKCGKTVAMFYVSASSDVIYARCGGDYMAKMIELAGGTYVMADMEADKGGSAQISIEGLYSRIKDADYIFYLNHFSRKFHTISEMTEYNNLFADVKAVREGNVFVTAPNYMQSMASVADIIVDMNTILNDRSSEETHFLNRID